MSIFSALFFLILWGAVQSASIPSKNVRLLKIKVPLELEFCKQLGYTETSAINFMKQTQSVARNDHLYKALVMLDMTGCSELLRAYTCAIYGPPVISKYSTALPPCRSLCKKVKKACWTPVVALLSKNARFYCDYQPTPSDKIGCVDYAFDEDLGEVVRFVRGDPKARYDDWKIPQY